MNADKREKTNEQVKSDEIAAQKKRLDEARSHAFGSGTLMGMLKKTVFPTDTIPVSASIRTVNQIREARKIQAAEGFEASETSVLAIAQILAINELDLSRGGI